MLMSLSDFRDGFTQSFTVFCHHSSCREIQHTQKEIHVYKERDHSTATIYSYITDSYNS